MNGNVLVVGGAPGMSGAARLAAEAALRVGAGLVHVAVVPESVASVMAGRPEIMCRGVAGPPECEDWIEAADVVVLGPGLGRSSWAVELIEAVLAAAKPLVVDADGLNYLAAHPRRRDDWVLTPHPGEAARLLGWTTADVQGARDRAVRALSEAFGGLVVLKGACTVIAAAGLDEGAEGGSAARAAAGPAARGESAVAAGAKGRAAPSESLGAAISLCDAGNPGMATAGMGDILAGVLGGLIGQFGYSRAVVECGVLVHALAGDAAALAGERGLIASDLFAHLRRQVNPG